MMLCVWQAGWLGMIGCVLCIFKYTQAPACRTSGFTSGNNGLGEIGSVWSDDRMWGPGEGKDKCSPLCSVHSGLLLTLSATGFIKGSISARLQMWVKRWYNNTCHYGYLIHTSVSECWLILKSKKRKRELAPEGRRLMVHWRAGPLRLDYTAGRCACVVSVRSWNRSSRMCAALLLPGTPYWLPKRTPGTSCNKRCIKTERAAEHRDYLYLYLKLFPLPLCFQGTTACDDHARARGRLRGRSGSRPMLVGCGGVILRVAPPITNYAETRAPAKCIWTWPKRCKYTLLFWSDS